MIKTTNEFYMNICLYYKSKHLFFLNRIYSFITLTQFHKFYKQEPHSRLSNLLELIKLSIINKSSFVTTFYKRNELVWNDGLIIDFLQKKSADLFIRKFVIFTGFLFSERFVFEIVVKLYLDNLI